MRKLAAVVGSVVLGFAGAVLAPVAAEADTVYIDGFKVPTFPTGVYPSSYLQGDRVKCSFKSGAIVVPKWEAVHVGDLCSDGKTAVADVSWRGGSGQVYHRICVNRFGAGTVVRCNLNWPNTTVRTVVAGVRSPYEWGTYKPF